MCQPVPAPTAALLMGLCTRRGGRGRRLAGVHGTVVVCAWASDASSAVDSLGCHQETLEWGGRFAFGCAVESEDTQDRAAGR